jgi:phosphoribosylamine--glycine ligase
MGDPETEVVMPRLKNDLVELLIATSKQQLNTVKISIDERFAAATVAVSGGYPNNYEKGFEISGLDSAVDDTLLFHSGTVKEKNKVVTNGGRVICVTALSPFLEDAVHKTQERLRQIKYEGMFYRRDIGYEFADSYSDDE